MMTLNKWLDKAKQNGIVKEKKSNNKNEGSTPSREQAIDILPKAGHWTPRFRGDKKEKTVLQEFMDVCPCVKEWLAMKPTSTQKIYGEALMRLCRQANILPDELGKLHKNKEEMEKARDIAWNVIKRQKSSHVALRMLNAVKSFYRFYTKGYQLPFDSQKGGHHRIKVKSKDKREKFVWGTMEQARERVFNIINEASMKFRTIFVMDLVTGFRANVFEHLKWKHLKNVIEVDGEPVMVIQVTPELDQKLESAGVEFYYAFVTKYALRTLRQYEAKFRGNATDEDYVFRSQYGNIMDRRYINIAWKGAVRRAEEKGLLPTGAYNKLWFHRLRALFMKFVRNSPITDDEYKQFIMGHVLAGSREAYAERDPLELAKEYLKINFEPPIEYLNEQLRKAKEEVRKAIEEKERREAEVTVREELEEKIDEEYLKPTEPAWQTPKIEHQTLPAKTQPKPTERITVSKMQIVKESIHDKVERIIKPAPKWCPRGKSFGPNATDEYCHNLCAKQAPTEYQACQELQEEKPKAFI